MSDQYAGSKRKARLQAQERQACDAFAADLRALTTLAQRLDSDEQLDGFLLEIEDETVRAEVRSLILSLRQPRVELAASPEDLRRVVTTPSDNRLVLIPTEAGPLVLES